MPERAYKILAYDDSLTDLRLLHAALAECGYPCELITVNSHADAEDRLAAERFDLMISGFGTDFDRSARFLRAVRRLAPLMPIVVLSGLHDPSPAYAAGANAFVSKPVDVEALFEKIRILIRFWTTIAELPRHLP